MEILLLLLACRVGALCSQVSIIAAIVWILGNLLHRMVFFVGGSTVVIEHLNLVRVNAQVRLNTGQLIRPSSHRNEAAIEVR